MLPPRFEERMRRLLGTRAEELFRTLNTPLSVRGIRANRIKCLPERLESLLDLPLTRTPFSPDGFVTSAPFRAGADVLHHAGAYYVQEASAMSAVTLLDPQPGERVLDACAAPGGKTTQIAAALGDTGLLWANEYSLPRARALAANVERCGTRRAVVSHADAVSLAAALPGWFDAVLADVPCSGEGMFRKEPAALEGWSEDVVHRSAARAAAILDAVACCVRPGGRLVLSTCTFAPEENEWAVVRFLAAHPDFALEEAALPFGEPGFDAETIAPFGSAAEKVLAAAVPLGRCRRVFPWQRGEGHFLARFRRAGCREVSFLPPAVPVPDAAGAAEACRDVYASCFFKPPVGVFCRTGDVVFLLPEPLPATPGIHLLAAGVAAGTVASGRRLRVEPSHALFQSAAAVDCRQLVDFETSDPDLRAFLRGEAIAAPMAEGYTGVACAGMLTGFGKAASGRLNNRYPHGLRLRS